MELQKEHQFNGGVLRMLRKDVILISYDTSNRIDVDQIVASRDKRKELIGDQPYYPIIDCTNGFTRFTPEAKKWVAENLESSTLRILDILWVNNIAMKIEAKLYLKLYKPINETRIVLSIPEALEIIDAHKSNCQAC